MRKELSSYRKELQKLMDAGNVEIGKQSRIEDILADIARNAGVQPNDLLFGVYDPTPGAKREIVSYQELVEGDWQPPNRITR
jgi:hypothetical protein